MEYSRLNSNWIEENIPVGTRVQNLSLTFFLADVIDSYVLELEAYTINNKLYRNKFKFHVNSMKININAWKNEKFLAVDKRYNYFLMEQLDEKNDELKHDFKIFYLCIKQYLDRSLDNPSHSEGIALASMILTMADYFLLKQDDFCAYVRRKIREEYGDVPCKFSSRDSRIANISRHAREYIKQFSNDGDANLKESTDIMNAYRVLDNKLSHLVIDLCIKE